MKILVGDKEHIDFSSPIEMTVQQRKQFIDFLKTIFEPSVVQEQEVSSFRENRLGDMKAYPSKWTDEEQDYLLSSYKDLNALSEALGRSWMSINQRYGKLIGAFCVWRVKNNKIIASGNYTDLIKEFLKDLRAPKDVIELAKKIKDIHQWFFYIKSDNKIIFDKLEPKPSEKTFKQAIKLLKNSDEFKANYEEYFND